MPFSVIPARPRFTRLRRADKLQPESRNAKNFWTPAPVPDRDPGFAGVTAQRILDSDQ